MISPVKTMRSAWHHITQQKRQVHTVKCPATVKVLGTLAKFWFSRFGSQASRDPSAHRRGQVKSNTLTCTPRHNSCVPNQIAGKVWNIYCTQSTSGSRPEHGPESILCCDRSRPGSWLFHHEARATLGRRVTAHKEAPHSNNPWHRTTNDKDNRWPFDRQNQVEHCWQARITQALAKAGRQNSESIPSEMKPDVLARSYA